ncbi:MAG TPA: DUF5931 domain-containing protein [Jatrophihabitantaceae bacterium]|nr:DUF5931 domain-containing protein [Jatrophihabitantaceae bacterium]
MTAGIRGPTRQSPISGVLLSLWRAAVTFRIVSAVFCAYLILRWRHLYAEPAIAYAVGGAIIAVTAIVAVVGWTGRAHRPVFVTADLVISIVLTVLSRPAQHPKQFHGDMLTLTSVWAAGPAIEAGLLLGSVAGVVAALLQFGASAYVRDGYDGRTLANGFLLVVVGGIAGFLATVTVRAEQDRALAAAERARMSERDRLTRSIHDGVLQVLGLVHRRGLESGGEWALLAKEAAIHEAALRSLMTSPVIAPEPRGLRDLGAELASLRSAQVTVSTPETSVLLPTHDATEVVAAVRAALHNVEQHAGVEAHAWVFLEQLDGKIAVSVRDDGRGMDASRPDAAHADGRLGIAQSIRGRIADLGGTVGITSSPGNGTEVEIVFPISPLREEAQ